MFVDPNGLADQPLIRHVYSNGKFSAITDIIGYIKECIEASDEIKKDYWIQQLKLRYTKTVQMVCRAAQFLADDGIAGR